MIEMAEDATPLRYKKGCILSPVKIKPQSLSLSCALCSSRKGRAYEFRRWKWNQWVLKRVERRR